MAADPTPGAGSRVGAQRLWLVTGVVVSAAAAALLTIHLDALSEARDGTPVARLVMLTALSLAPVALALRRGGDLLSPIVLVALYFLTAYAIRGWAIDAGDQGVLDLTPRTARSLEGYLTPSLDVAIAGLAAFILGYLCLVSPALGGYLPRPREPIRRDQVTVAGWALLAVGLPCFTVAAAAPGRVLSSSLSELLLNLSALAMVGFAFLVIGARGRGERSGGLPPWVPAALFGYLLAGAVLQGSKAAVLWVLLAGAVALHYGRGRLPVGWLVAGAATFVLVFLPTIQTFRNVLNDPDGPSVPRAIARLPERIVDQDPDGKPRDLTPHGYVGDALASTTSRLYGIDTLVVARALTPNVHPFLDGSSYGRLPASFVPRLAWPDKPEVSFASEYADTYWGRQDSDDESTQPVGVVGELYINWGVPAVFLGMLLLGAGYRVWFTWLARDWSPMAIALYVVSVPTMVQVEADAVFLFRTAVNRVVVTLAALVLLGWALSALERRRSEGPNVSPAPAVGT